MKMRPRVLLPLVLVLAGWIEASVIAKNDQAQANVDLVPAQAVKAVLAEDWQQVADLLTDNICSGSPVARLIKGHACLALNRNNESLCLFLSASAEHDLSQWDKWTLDFQRMNARRLVAQYLRGDALARLREYEAALQTFTEALKDNPAHALTLNAYGLANAKTGRLKEARVYFEEAARTGKLSLADAYANIGALRIQEKEGVEGALAAFDQALRSSPDFALALHGRGCVKLTARKPDATADLNRASEKNLCGGLASLFAENILRIEAFWTGKTEQELIAMHSGKEAGTTMRAQSIHDAGLRALGDYVQRPFQGNANGIINRLGELQTSDPNLAGRYANEIKQTFAMHPELTAMFAQHRREMLTTSAQLEPFVANLLSVTARATGWAIGTSLGAGSPATLAAGAYLGNLAGEQVGSAAKTGLDNWSNQTLRTLGQLNQYMPMGNAVGGADSSFEKAIWEDGHWPFLPLFGLLYR